MPDILSKNNVLSTSCPMFLKRLQKSGFNDSLNYTQKGIDATTSKKEKT